MALSIQLVQDLTVSTSVLKMKWRQRRQTRGMSSPGHSQNHSRRKPRLRYTTIHTSHRTQTHTNEKLPTEREADARCRIRKYGQQASMPFNSFPAVKMTSGVSSQWRLTSNQQTMMSSRCFTPAGAVQLYGAALEYIVSAFRTSPLRHSLLIRAPTSEVHLAATRMA